VSSTPVPDQLSPVMISLCRLVSSCLMDSSIGSVQPAEAQPSGGAAAASSWIGRRRPSKTKLNNKTAA
jgi:hypothetical protein